jgi:NAD(P)-dependent dehydrogenase (short-subunit alcohol dehydrogenase family)
MRRAMKSASLRRRSAARLDSQDALARSGASRSAGVMQSAGAISPAPRARLPHPFPTGYDNGSKTFLDSFAFALRNELKDAGVTVSCLMPGTTETEFFRRAERPRGAVAAIVYKHRGSVRARLHGHGRGHKSRRGPPTPPTGSESGKSSFAMVRIISSVGASRQMSKSCFGG